MKAITIKQPFASLIAAGLKEYEFRKILKEKNPMLYSSMIKHTEWEGYAFKIENVEKIEPIPAKGKLGIWEFEYDQQN